MAPETGAQPSGARPSGLVPRAVIDGFELLDLVHHGGMSSLWRVHRAGDAQPLIMKVPHLGDDPTAIVGFEVEQMILPMLSGRHVPRYVCAGGFDRQPYIVMEMLQGRSLRARLDEGALDPAEVARIGVRIAESLHDLHQQRVIHLDIKPSNIMFREDGNAVLVDYGLARHDHLPDLLAEQFRLPMGTGPYISPEQVLHNRTDARSDIFALGVILYLLATGVRPFGMPTSIRGLRRRLHDQPVPPRALRPGIPPWLQEAILRCLEVDPDRRYATAAQLAFDLAHPENVVLTERAARTRRQSRLRRWRNFIVRIARRPEYRSVEQLLVRAPIVVVAIDQSQEWEALALAMRAAVRQVLHAAPEARLTCVSVLRINRMALDGVIDASGRHRHVQSLLRLQHWARPLELPASRVTFQVLESPDAAPAIIEYANANRVEHIVVGSRGSSTLRRYLGSVSTQIVAQAGCTVTVVKVPAAENLG